MTAWLFVKRNYPACWAPSGDGEVVGGQGTMSNEQ